MIGSIISGIADFQNSVMNIASGAKAMYDSDRNYNEAVRQYEQNQANWEKEFAQNQANWDKSFEYQQLVNDTTWAREDNAVQRKAADLAAAGINPMLAGLGSAQAAAGGVISPMFHSGGNTATGIPAATQADFGTNMNHLGKAIEELEKRKSTEKLQANDIDAKLELQKREIEASSLSSGAKFEHEKEIENMKEIHELVKLRENANNTAEQAALDRDLSWKIATHKALRELFKNSEIPGLATIWDNMVSDSYDEKGNFIFNKFKKNWEDFNEWRDENLKKSLGYKKDNNGNWRNEKGDIWNSKKSKTQGKGGGRSF